MRQFMSKVLYVYCGWIQSSYPRRTSCPYAKRRALAGGNAIINNAAILRVFPALILLEPEVLTNSTVIRVPHAAISPKAV